MEDYSVLESILGYTFKNKLLLKEALTHRSYLNENRRHGVPHNERLEFLGDAVLELIVTEHLFFRFPGRQEGQLTQLRSYLVNGEKACGVAKMLRLNDFIFLSRGESKALKARDVILANAFEAILGAIYVDRGFEEVKKIIERFLLTKENVEMQEVNDPKSKLQEQVQGKVGVSPRYQLIQESGPEHDKSFEVEVYVGAVPVGKGKGRSKAEAEKAAAREALKALAK